MALHPIKVQGFLFFCCVMMTLQAGAQRLTVTGHRGAAALAPENTLASVRRAMEIGVDRVEIDVQQTADGVVIVLHDRDLDRTTDMRGRVAKLKWAEVRKARANRGFEKQYPGELIPTLDDILRAINGRCTLVIEIKDGHERYPDIEKRVLDAIKANRAEQWCVIHTFNDKVIHRLRELHCTVPVQKLLVGIFPFTSLMLDFRLHFAELTDYPDVDAFTFSHGMITRQNVTDAHALGKKVHVYTVNNEHDMRQMISYGVDGIITDRPDLLRRILDGK